MRWGVQRTFPVEGFFGQNFERSFHITPDGQQFLVAFPADQVESGEPARHQINIVLNWFEELTERVPLPKGIVLSRCITCPAPKTFIQYLPSRVVGISLGWLVSRRHVDVPESYTDSSKRAVRRNTVVDLTSHSRSGTNCYVMIRL